MWFAQAEEYVRLRRGDVLIEAAPGSAEEFIDSALPFATTGYPVKLVVLAVREADSCATPGRCSAAAPAGSPHAPGTTHASARSLTSSPSLSGTRRSRP
jgi:hypothetical protein